MLVSFVTAMLATMALIPLLTRVAGRLGMLDMPGPRKVHVQAVPRVGGLAMVAGVLIPLLVLDILPRQILAIVSGVLVVVAAGAWDDRRTLGYREKFAAQIVAAAIVVLGGGLQIARLELWTVIELPSVVAIPLTIVTLVALTNAVNLADGLDGLAGGISFLCCCALGVLAYTAGNTPALILALATAGAILGFLRFNTYPASVFMGDGGSQFLGLTIASLAVLVTQPENAPVSATTPLFLLALPVLDTAFVMLHRMREGRSPFTADKNHLHHRLLALGFTHHEAVASIYVVQGLMFVAGWALHYETDLTNIVVFALIGALLIGVLLGAKRFGWRLRSEMRDAAPSAPAPVAGVHSPALGRAASLTLRLALAGYCLLGAFALEVPRDIGYLAGALLPVWIVATSRPVRRVLPIVEKVTLYVLAAVLAYLVTQVGWQRPLPQLVEPTLIGGLALATVAALRFNATQRFRLTSLDLLVLFMAVVVPSLPGVLWGDVKLASLAARLAVLFYALEVALHPHEHGARYHRWIVLGALASLTVRSLL